MFTSARSSPGYKSGWASTRRPSELQVTDWLATPQQLLLAVTAGAVFHDEPGTLTLVRRMLAWYPDDVWRYLLACQWRRVAQEEPFVGRTAESRRWARFAGSDRPLVRDLMRLCFLIERRYAPYSKWLGSAFAQLSIAPALSPYLEEAMAATTYEPREQALAAAYELVAELTTPSAFISRSTRRRERTTGGHSQY